LKIEIENVHNRHYTLRYFHYGKNAAETSRIICEIYGEHIVSISESTYQFWFQDFEVEISMLMINLAVDGLRR